jgi:hypothetical protein
MQGTQKSTREKALEIYVSRSASNNETGEKAREVLRVRGRCLSVVANIVRKSIRIDALAIYEFAPKAVTTEWCCVQRRLNYDRQSVFESKRDPFDD